VPTRATATAPAMRNVLPSAATSPTARTRPAGAVLLLLLIDGSGTALHGAGRRGGRRPAEGAPLAATAGA
jgi:hypothetical protein